MRAFAVLLALTLVVAVAYADSEPKGDCHSEDLKLDVKRGEVAYPKDQCLRVFCPEEGDMRVEPCEFAIPPGCHVVDGDLTKQWPGCCPTVKCDSEQ